MTEPDAIVALATDSIVYAPLFIAAEAGFFDGLPVRFGVIRSASGEDHVSSAVRAIWSAFESAVSPPLVTVCDPIHALLYNWVTKTGDHRQAIAGTLLQSPACWVFDHDHRLSRILKNLGTERLPKIKTHPRGMTADTMTRWLLLKRGRIEESELDRVIENQTTPGAELDDFGEQHHWHRLAAVSVDYLRMHELQAESAKIIRICEGIQRDSELRRYVQTVLLAPINSPAERVGKLQRGLHIALDLIAHDPEQAAGWLQRHYVRRTARAVALPPYLIPLGNDPSMGALPIGRVKAFLTSGVFARRIRRGDLKDQIDQTWNIYRRANQKQLQDLANRYGNETPRNGSQWLRPFEPRKRATLTQRTVRDLLFRLTASTIGGKLSEHALRVADWLKGLHGHLTLSAYAAVEFYLCADGERRQRLREVAEGFAAKRADRQRAGRPYILGLFGGSGAGKGAFVSALRRRLQRVQEVSGYADITLGSSFPRSELETRISQVLATIMPLATCDRPSLFFVDEVNKWWDSYKVFLNYLEAKTPSGSGLHGDLKNIAWVFAGTVAPDGDAAINVMRHMSHDSGAPDFAGRLQSGAVLATLPDLSDPLERIIRVMMMIGSDMHTFPRPDKVDALALFWFGVTEICDPRELEGRVFAGLSRMRRRGDGRLDVADVADGDARARLLSMYHEVLDGLSSVSIAIGYDHGVEVGV
jgi:hypothetical protein